jgi:hypothetical protein
MASLFKIVLFSSGKTCLLKTGPETGFLSLNRYRGTWSWTHPYFRDKKGFWDG